MRTAAISFDRMTASAVVISTDLIRAGRPVQGLAFDSIGRYGHGGLLRERFIPRLLAADPDDYADGAGGIDPARAWAIMMKGEKPGGHGERPGAVGLLDSALWDLAAKLADVPLWRLLSNHFSNGATGFARAYASGGHYRGEDDIPTLRREIATALDSGHENFKLKICGLPLDQDLRRIEAARAQIAPGRLAADGNGGMTRELAFQYAAALAGFELAWLEEPVEPLDFALHAEIATAWPAPLATGENLFSTPDLRNMLRHGGLRPDRDLLQIDISLSYGITEFANMLTMAAGMGWQHAEFAPHAGHLLALHAVAGFGLGWFELAADRASPFGCLPAGSTVDHGRVFAGDAAGVGFEATPQLMTLFAGLIA